MIDALCQDLDEQIDAGVGLGQVIGGNPEPLQIVDGQHRISEMMKTIDEAGTIGELHDALPADEWVDLPQYGVRVKKWPDER